MQKQKLMLWKQLAEPLPVKTFPSAAQVLKAAISSSQCGPLHPCNKGLSKAALQMRFTVSSILSDSSRKKISSVSLEKIVEKSLEKPSSLRNTS